jgi:hypothetical protein
MIYSEVEGIPGLRFFLALCTTAAMRAVRVSSFFASSTQ